MRAVPLSQWVAKMQNWRTRARYVALSQPGPPLRHKKRLASPYSFWYDTYQERVRNVFGAAACLPLFFCPQFLATVSVFGNANLPIGVGFVYMPVAGARLPKWTQFAPQRCRPGQGPLRPNARPLRREIFRHLRVTS